MKHMPPWCRLRPRSAETARIPVPIRALSVVLFAALACAQVPANALALVMPQKVDGTAVEMDRDAYPDIAQVPVTLYDYGRESDGVWVSKDPSTLNDKLDGGDASELYAIEMPRSMRFWDTMYERWGDSGNPTSFLTDGWGVIKAGQFQWGLFKNRFGDWSHIVDAPSRDLFGKSSDSCYYEGSRFKQVYDGVLMDFSYNRDTNTYHYSSNESTSTFDGSSRLVKGERTAGTGASVGFWPFGEGDVHFGLAMDFDFRLPSQSYLDSNEYYFAFSGDDDLVVYVDDTLALDLGGAHTAVAGYIDFANEMVVYGTCTIEEQLECFEASVASSGIPMHGDGFDEAGVNWNLPTYGYVKFSDLGIDLERSANHNFKLAYLERGGDASNLAIEMNMQIRANVDYEVVGELHPDESLTDPVPVDSAEYDLYDKYVSMPAPKTSDEGYVFEGWYNDEGCTSKWVDGTPLSSAHTTLYGKWSKPECLKTSDPESGTEVVPGQRICYTVEYTNSTGTQQKVKVSDAVPEGTTLAEDSVSAKTVSRESAGIAEGTATIDLGLVESGHGIITACWEALNPGDKAVLEFAVTADGESAGSTIVNRADIAVNDGASVFATNTTEHPVTAPDAGTVVPVDEDDDGSGGTGTPSPLKGYVPKTGDGNITVIALLLSAAIAGICVLVKAMSDRRRSDEQSGDGTGGER